MSQLEEQLDENQIMPFLSVYKNKNETICGYEQKHPPNINGLCSNQYFGLMNIYDVRSKQLLVSQCCILISPIHAITAKSQLVNEEGQLNYESDQIQVVFGQQHSYVTSYVQLDRFLLITLQYNFGNTLGYVGLMSRELENLDEYTNLNLSNPAYIQGLNEQGIISYFQAIVYKENTNELEVPNCGFIKLLQGCALLKYDTNFGICLQGLVDYSDEKQRIVVQKVQFKDILIIAEVILAGGVVMSEKKLDITALYSLDQKTFLNQKAKIYRKSLCFEKNIQSLESKKQQQLQLIDLKVINSRLLSAISKQGDLFIIDMDKNSIEQIIPLDEPPSLLQVIHDELFIGLNKRLLVINYVQGYSPVRTYSFDSQILSMLSLENAKSNISTDTQCLIGCFNGLYLLNGSDKTPKKLDIPKIALNKVLNLQKNQEINNQSPLNSYNIYSNNNQVLLSSSEKIMIIDWKQNIIKKQFIGHSKNVYFIEQVRVNLLLSGSSDCSLILWDKFNGSLLKQFQFSHPIYYGFLLNQSELVTIDYNTVRIFNTVTFKYIKYEYHLKPITCSTMINQNTFITCDTSNQIILWKADTFIAGSFMDSEFVKLFFKISLIPQLLQFIDSCLIKQKIRKQSEDKDHLAFQQLDMKFSEDERDFEYKPHNLKGPILLKYQLQLEDSKNVQQRLREDLENQICQNIEQKLIYQQKINQMETFIAKKNKDLQRIISNLDKKQTDINEAFQEIQERTDELQNYVTFQNDSRQTLGKTNLKNSFHQSITTEGGIDKGENLAFHSAETMATNSMENLMTVKKQGNIFIDDLQQTEKKNDFDKTGNYQTHKSGQSQQFSSQKSQKTKNTYESKEKLKQFDTNFAEIQNKSPQKSSIIDSDQQSNLKELYKSTQSTETKQQRSRQQSLQNETVKKQGWLNTYSSNQYQSNHFQNEICNPLQDSIKANIDEQFIEDTNCLQTSKEKIKQTYSTLDQQNTINDNEEFRRYSTSLQNQFIEQLENELNKQQQQQQQQQLQQQQQPPFYNLNNENDQRKFIIKPLPLENNQIDFNDQTEFILTESNLVSDKRQALNDKSFEQCTSKQSYIQQLNEILNSMQNLKQQNNKSSIESTQTKQLSNLDKNSQKLNKELQNTNILQQSNQILENLNNLQTSNFKQSSLIQSSKKDEEDQLQGQLKSYLEESIIKESKNENLDQYLKNSLKEKNLNQQEKQNIQASQKSSEKRKSDKKPKMEKEDLLKSINKMEKMEESLLKNDPLLLELYSLIKSSK